MPKKIPDNTASKPPSKPAMLLDNQLCFSLYSASLAMTRLYKPLLDALDLSYPQYLVMLALWERDGLGVSELGARLGLDSGTLTPLLKRMATAGLLVRQRSSEDERRVNVRLSPAGKRLQSRAAHIPGCLVAQSGLPVADLVALNHQIKSLRSAMHKPTSQAAN